MLIPLRVYVPTDRTPWVNYGLMAVTILISVIGFYSFPLYKAMSGVEITVAGESLADLEVGVGLTGDTPWPVLALSSTLLHGDWMHLIGNMLFLWLFGNAVNYKLGHLGYLGLYFCAALLSGMAHYVFVGSPVVGASGAIMGVVGAFLVFFPRNDVTVFWMIWLRPGLSTVSGFWIILYWVAWDLLYLVLGIQTTTAVWSHVAGFAIGFAAGMICAAAGWIKPTPWEQTLLQVLRGEQFER